MILKMSLKGGLEAKQKGVWTAFNAFAFFSVCVCIP